MLATTLLLVGCDGGYDILLENWTARPVTIQYLQTEQELGPCSATGRGTVGPPWYAKGIEFTATDADGNSLPVEVSRQSRPLAAITRLHVRVVDANSSTCSTARTDQFMVQVINRSDRKVRLKMGNQELGILEPHGSSRFGPLPGTWESAWNIEIKEVGGGALLFRDVRVDYELGQTPEVTMGIIDVE